MDETRLRAVIREEIRLAVKTLADGMWSSDPEDSGASFEQSASSFDVYAYRGAYEAADAERSEAAKNPFEEAEPDTVDAAVQALVRSEVLDALRELRSTFYMSGLDDDSRIAERLDHVITNREQRTGK